MSANAFSGVVVVPVELKWFSFHLFRYQTNTANEMLTNIVNIQPKDTGGGSGETRESVVYRLADDMLDKLPEDYVPHQVS